MTMATNAETPLFDPSDRPAGRSGDSFRKLDPRTQVRNPVMFVVYVGSILTTGLFVQALVGHGEAPAGFILAVAVWLWFTVLFANFAEAMAEGRGKAQAAALRQTRRHRGRQAARRRRAATLPRAEVASTDLRKGDLVLVEAGDIIPGDGEVVEGVASVDESAITGESAPVIRESGGDRSSVTGGTRVLSDWLIVRITANPGETFLDRMIALVEGAKRQKTPNEIALDDPARRPDARSSCWPPSRCCRSRIYSVTAAGQGTPVTVTVLVALLVCLIPTTIGGLLSAIGIAGMDRMIQANVIAMSGRAVEAAGDVDVLLLDKTGTITLGNRQATDFIPAAGDRRSASSPMRRSSRRWPTRRRRGAASWCWPRRSTGIRERDIQALNAHFVPFTAQTRMSGVDLERPSDPQGRRRRRRGVRRRAGRALSGGRAEPGGRRSPSRGGTPLVVAEDARGARA